MRFCVLQNKQLSFPEQNKPISLYNEYAVHFSKGKSEMFFVQ